MDTNVRLQEPQHTESSIFNGIGDEERIIYLQGVKKARNALFAAGGIMFVADIIMLLIGRETMTEPAIWIAVSFDIVILAAFIGLGFWTKRKPFTAIITGLILFCAVQVLAMVLDPTNIYKGIFVKIAVVTALVSGMKNARKLQELDTIEGGRLEK